MNLETDPRQLDERWYGLDLNGYKFGSAIVKVSSKKEQFKGTTLRGISTFVPVDEIYV